MGKNIFARLWEGLLNYNRRGRDAIFNMNHVSVLVNLNCPKCGAQLYGYTGEDSGIRLYGCRKCGYQGSIGLPLDKKPVKMPKNKLKHEFS